MMDETLNDLGQDAAAVAAVRNGDAERYRELVERHERRVFAVAWSRLGDAALAEEATQEAFIRGYDPFQDTWQSLVILEAFESLNRVDRAACIAGILRFHHGKGLFGSVQNRDGLSITGDTKDTFYAFESLRILHALDQVKDLEAWRFRPMSTSKPAEKSTTRFVTWWEIEAWVCQQRLERFLRERKENPNAPIRSLLEP